MDYLKSRKDLRDNDIVNKWKLILRSSEIDCGVQYCANVINQRFKNDEVILVCILKGAVFFHVDLSRYLTIPHTHYFIEASSYHNKQTQSETLEILSKIVPSKFENRKVILLDELFDSGNTLYKLKHVIHETAKVKLEDIFTCTLFIKNRKTEHPQPDIFGLYVPDVWLVGYGLDDQSEKRNWIHLYGCPKVDGIKETEDDSIFKDETMYIKMREKIEINIHCLVSLYVI